jgi:hypothetical protein
MGVANTEKSERSVIRSPVSFHEVQRFRNPLLWLVVGGIAALMWAAAFVQLVRGRPFGDKPASDVQLLTMWILFGLGLPALFWFIGLVTEVAEDGVRVRFRPFPGRLIPWQEIEDAEVIRYRPLRDFGGWGVRWGRGQRRAYTVSGDTGVELTLRDGRRVVLGSHEPEQLHRALESGRSAGQQKPTAP